MNATLIQVRANQTAIMKFLRGALVALAIELLLSACSRSPANRITVVLNQCSEISQRAAAWNNNPSQQAQFVAVQFQNIDVTKCPADFRMAFQRHIFAWQQAAPALDQGNQLAAFFGEIIAGAAQNPNYVPQTHQADQAMESINATYFQVTQIAAKYGARIPQSVVGE